jgi:hypothetical protein
MTARDVIALGVIGAFFLVALVIISFVPLGYTDLAGAKGMLESWVAADSLLVGAVAGSYFPRLEGPRPKAGRGS